MIELLNYSHDYNLLLLDMQILHFQSIYFFFIMQINKKSKESIVDVIIYYILSDWTSFKLVARKKKKKCKELILSNRDINTCV